ncbi:MAG: hypothetical protein M0D55_12315 [Elusimicrobiota bacterium]|nr:MAG: hypothetical protein M0D55_12315 [Elusimicrobiota bacterium]
MKKPITAAAFLLAASVSMAQVRVVTEIAMPASPSAASINSLSASPALPGAALIPSLAAPSIMPSIAAPVPAAAPVPVEARAALAQTGVALAAASKGEGDPAEISRRAFDASSKQGPEAAASPVAGREVSHTAGLEGADYARRFRAATAEPSSPVSKAAWETVEVAATSIPFMIAAAILRANASDWTVTLPALALIWGAGYWAMRRHLAGVRSTVVGGWQASHDQKYRTDFATGQLKDIRGHKYGSDRYEEYAPGPVGRVATALIAAGAGLGAAAFLLL